MTKIIEVVYTKTSQTQVFFISHLTDLYCKEGEITIDRTIIQIDHSDIIFANIITFINDENTLLKITV